VYLVNSYLNTTAYGIWRVANISSGTPLLWRAVRYGTYNNGQQPNAPGGLNAPISTGTPRILQVAGLGDDLFPINTVACQFTPNTSLEACAKLGRIRVGSGAGASMLVTLSQEVLQGGGDGWYYFYPSVAVTTAGAVVSAWDVGSTNGFFSSAWGVKPYASTSYTQVVYLAQGQCQLTGTYQSGTGWNMYRAGDYAGASADPDGVRVWVAAERAANIPAVTGGCGWQTRIAAITP
jgi:hypothetical protein